MGIRDLLVDGEESVNKLLYFDVAQFHRDVAVGNKYYHVEQWVTPLLVKTSIYIYCDSEESEEADIHILITRWSVPNYPKKYYIDVYWKSPRAMSRSRELTLEEYSKLMEGVAKLLKAYIGVKT